MYNVIAIFKAIDNVSNVTSAISANLGGMASQVAAAGATMVQAGKMMTIGLTLPIVGVGVAALKLTSDFDQAMRNVNAVLRLPEAQFQSLREQVREFGYDTRSSATDVANSLYMVVKAGYDTDTAFDLMSVTAHAAAAGLTTTEHTTKAVVSALRAYNMGVEEAEYVTDLMVKTTQKGMLVTMDELSKYFPLIASQAALSGVSLEEMSAALVTTSNAGIETRRAITSLTYTLRETLKPGKELQAVLENAGYASGEAALKAVGLAGVMNIVYDATEGSADGIQQMYHGMLASRGAMILLQNEGKNFAENLEMMEDRSHTLGIMEATRTEQYKALDSQMMKLRRTTEAFMIDVMDVMTPKLLEWVKGVQSTIKGFRNMTDEAKMSTIKWAAFLALLGPGLIVLGSLVQAIATLWGTLGSLQVYLTSATSGFGRFLAAARSAWLGLVALTGGFGAALVVIGLVAAAIYLVVRALQAQAEAAEEARAHSVAVAQSAESYKEYAEKINTASEQVFRLEEGTWRLAKMEEYAAIQRSDSKEQIEGMWRGYQDLGEQIKFYTQGMEGATASATPYQAKLKEQALWHNLGNAATLKHIETIQEYSRNQMRALVIEDARMAKLVAFTNVIDDAVYGEGKRTLSTVMYVRELKALAWQQYVQANLMKYSKSETEDMTLAVNKLRYESGALMPVMMNMNYAFGKQINAMNKMGGQIFFVEAAQNRLIGTTDALENEYQQTADAIGMTADETEYMAVVLGYTDAEFTAIADDLEITGGEMEKLARSTGMGWMEIERLNTELRWGQSQIEEYGQAVQDSTQDVYGSITGMADTWENTGKRIEDINASRDKNITEIGIQAARARGKAQEKYEYSVEQAWIKHNRTITGLEEKLGQDLTQQQRDSVHDQIAKQQEGHTARLTDMSNANERAKAIYAQDVSYAIGEQRRKSKLLRQESKADRAEALEEEKKHFAQMLLQAAALQVSAAGPAGGEAWTAAKKNYDQLEAGLVEHYGFMLDADALYTSEILNNLGRHMEGSTSAMGRIIGDVDSLEEAKAASLEEEEKLEAKRLYIYSSRGQFEAAAAEQAGLAYEINADLALEYFNATDKAAVESALITKGAALTVAEAQQLQATLYEQTGEAAVDASDDSAGAMGELGVSAVTQLSVVTGAVEAFVVQLGAIPPNPSTKITAMTTQAALKLHGVQGLIAGINDKTVTITIITKEVGGAVLQSPEMAIEHAMWSLVDYAAANFPLTFGVEGDFSATGNTPGGSTNMVTQVEMFVTTFANLIDRIRKVILHSDVRIGKRLTNIMERTKLFAENITASIEAFRELARYTTRLDPERVEQFVTDVFIVVKHLVDHAKEGARKAEKIGGWIESAFGIFGDVIDSLHAIAAYRGVPKARMVMFLVDFDVFFKSFLQLAASFPEWGVIWMESFSASIGGTVKLISDATKMLAELGSVRRVPAVAIQRFIMNLKDVLDALGGFLVSYSSQAQWELEQLVPLMESVADISKAMEDIAKGMSEIATYEPVGEFSKALDRFMTDMRKVLKKLADIETEFESIALERTAGFAETLGLIGKALGEAMALKELAEFEGVSMRALGSFEADMGNVLRVLSRMSEHWDEELIGAALAFIEPVSDIADAVGDAAGGLMDLSEYGDTALLALDRFSGDVRDILNMMEEIAGEWETQAVSAIGKFTEVLGGIGGNISDAVEGFVSLTSYRGIDSKNIAAFRQDVLALLRMLAGMEDQFTDLDPDALTGMAGKMGLISEAVTESLFALRSIGGYKSNLGKGLQAFISDVRRLVVAMHNLAESLPEWLTPGSPTPLQIGLEGATEALGGMQGMLADTSGLFATRGPAELFAKPTATVGEGGGEVHYHNHLDYHAHTREDPGERDAARVLWELGILTS